MRNNIGAARANITRKPNPQLLVAKRLQEGFLHLEPLELEMVQAACRRKTRS